MRPLDAAVQGCGERELQSTPPRIVLKPPHFKSSLLAAPALLLTLFSVQVRCPHPNRSNDRQYCGAGF